MNTGFLAAEILPRGLDLAACLLLLFAYVYCLFCLLMQHVSVSLFMFQLISFFTMLGRFEDHHLICFVSTHSENRNQKSIEKKSRL